MPHIHTKPNQHDATVSGYFLLYEKNEWKCLVHYHRKIDVLMQISGHIELTENPWQAAVHEIEEESGYGVDELTLLQFTKDLPEENGNIMHPQVIVSDTHNVGDGHFHSDLCYGFVAAARPKHRPSDTESNDLRWMTLAELEKGAKTEKC